MRERVVCPGIRRGRVLHEGLRRPGARAGAGTCTDKHEKAMIAYLNGKVGGIMFWAVNEGASGGPNGNGQTTGANSVALANYAAAL